MSLFRRDLLMGASASFAISGCSSPTSVRECSKLPGFSEQYTCQHGILFPAPEMVLGAIIGAVLGGVVGFAVANVPGAIAGAMIGGIAGGSAAYLASLVRRTRGSVRDMRRECVEDMRADGRNLDRFVQTGYAAYRTNASMPQAAIPILQQTTASSVRSVADTGAAYINVAHEIGERGITAEQLYSQIVRLSALLEDLFKRFDSVPASPRHNPGIRS